MEPGAVVLVANPRPVDLAQRHHGGPAVQGEVAELVGDGGGLLVAGGLGPQSGVEVSNVIGNHEVGLRVLYFGGDGPDGAEVVADEERLVLQPCEAIPSGPVASVGRVAGVAWDAGNDG